MVVNPASIDSIPDFEASPGVPEPGQRPVTGAADTREPYAVVLVAAPLDPGHINRAVDSEAVDAYIAAEVAAGRAFSIDAYRWAPWSPLQVELSYPTAMQYNYARFTIGANGRQFYAFLTAEYLNLHDSSYRVAPDYEMTYPHTLGYSMIERGHVAVAASQNDTYGANYLTAPEPIEAAPVRGVLDAALLGSTPDAWTVLVVSANDLRGGTGFPFWDEHVESDSIQGAAGLASSATINVAGTIQVTIDDAKYPWSVQTGAVDPGTGTPVNGYVPSEVDGVPFLVNLVSGPASLPPSPSGPIQGEANTAAAWAALKAAHPEAVLGGPAGGYWTRALDKAIHEDPAHYGVIDTGLSPIGHSPHGLGIRLNFSGVSEAVANSFGFTRFNDYTWTYNGPYIWAGMEPGAPQVFAPKVEASPLSTIDGVPAGGGVYLFTMEGFAAYMSVMQGAPWVTSGIIDVRLVPTWAVANGGDATFDPTLVPAHDPSDGMYDAAADIPVFAGTVVSGTAAPDVLNNWRDTVLAGVGATGWHKLVTAQFADLLVGNGDTLTSFRPDQWQDASIGFTAITGAAHGDPSIRIIPTGYNDLGSQMGVETPFGGKAGLMHSGYGIAASNPANQDLAPYLAAYSAHSSWTSNLLNLGLAKTLGFEKIALNAGVQGIQTVLGGGTSAVGGFLGAKSGEEGTGAAGGAIKGLLGAVGNLATANLQTANAITMIDISEDGSFDIGALQLGMSGVASVQAFDTWFQSLSSASGSGSAHSLASSWRSILGQAFRVIIALPTQERVKALVATWDRYGYMIGQAFTPNRLDAMTSRTYWKTAETTILGRMPKEAREAIAAHFEAGTTVWTNVADIGTQTTNNPRSGQEY